jgi:hypothetical protein
MYGITWQFCVLLAVTIGVRHGDRGLSEGQHPTGRPPLKWLLGRFRGGPPAGYKKVGHGGPRVILIKLREPIVTSFHTLMLVT